jgi:hypothetical protein
MWRRGWGVSTCRDDKVKAKWNRMTSEQRDAWVAREVFDLEVDPEDRCAVTVPCYTTNEESAQEVLRVMETRSRGVETGKKDGKHFCSIHVHSYYPDILFDPCAYEECSTLERAICLAALVVMEDAKL